MLGKDAGSTDGRPIRAEKCLRDLIEEIQPVVRCIEQCGAVVAPAVRTEPVSRS